MKRECHHIRQLLSEYIDGALDVSKMDAVKEHLNFCEDCSRGYEALKSLISRMGNITRLKAPDNFLEKVHKRIKARSLLVKIREAFSFSRTWPPLEAVAFTVTAILLLFVLTFFSGEEKSIFQNHGYENIELAADQAGAPSQIAENKPSSALPVRAPSSEGRINQPRTPVRLALQLTAPEEATPIPSQSVSFGNSVIDQAAGDLYPWQTPEDNNTRKRPISPDEVNQKIDDIIKSAEGKVLSRKADTESGYPAHLTLDIPGINYRRFISRLDSLGALQAPAPSLSDGSENEIVLIQMELSPPQ